jgi:hypothetical protein
MSPELFSFAFAPAYRLPALLLGITPRTAWVSVDEHELRVRYGLWSLRTPRSNIAGGQLTGDFSFLKTAGPPHLSFSDKGVSFATNGERGLCVQFHDPVAGIDPTKTIKHPGRR